MRSAATWGVASITFDLDSDQCVGIDEPGPERCPAADIDAAGFRANGTRYRATGRAWTGLA